jgi:membrane protease YdiL (CAAX protease family)
VDDVVALKKIFAFVAAVAACVFVYVFLQSLMRGGRYDLGSVAASLVLVVALGVVSHLFFRSDGRSLAELGFDAPVRRLGEFGVAFLAGCVLVAIWTLILWLLMSPRWGRYDGFDAGGAASRIAFCLFNNAGEELAYRGYLLVTLARRFGPTFAVVSTSVLFALLHIQGGLPWQSAVTIVFTCGVLFAVMLLRWNSLPLVLGFHVATNVAQELIGLRVTPLSVIRPTFSGALTAPIATLVAASAVNLLIVWFVLRKGVRNDGRSP